MNTGKSNNLADLSLMKKVIFSILVFIFSLLILEIFFRVVFSFKVGPSVLLYGTRFQWQQVEESAEPDNEILEAKNYISKMKNGEWKKQRTVITHANKSGGYSKYFPNQQRFDFDIETGERFEVTINNNGFRGKDFFQKKKPGVIRVINLGASSTFGYFDRDNETYPVYLEQILNRHSNDNSKFEVINLGIPHLTAAKIYKLYLAEVVQLDPDIVTFYEGNNDAHGVVLGNNSGSLFVKIANKAGSVSILIGFIDSLISSRNMIKYSSRIEQQAVEISHEFINSISKIYKDCATRGIKFIVANQQRNSQTIERAMLKGLTYKEEILSIKERSSQSVPLEAGEIRLLVHYELMTRLESWASDNQVPFVNIIKKLDNDRDVLLSWVHLSPKGNRMVAEAFAGEIFNLHEK